MINKEDWRLTNQLTYLKDKSLKYVKFKKYSETWEHEHCEFCLGKFSDESQHGYCTLNNNYWVCEKCFRDFKEMFYWTVI